MKQLILPANRAFNSNGISIPGAVARLYVSGTTTPAQFLDENGTPLGTKITANASGRFDPMPFQDDSTPFRLKVQEPDIDEDTPGSTLDDIDPFYFGNAVWGVVTSAAGGSYSSRSLLAGVTGVSKQSAILTESGREGSFVFDTSDLSTEVAADTAQGVYVAPATDTTGASGAWVRQITPRKTVDAAWFGLSQSATNAANRTALAAALSFANSSDVHKSVTIPNGSFTLSASVTIPDGVTLEGNGRNSILIAGNAATTDPWIINQTSGSNFTIRNLKMKPASSGDLHRSAIYLNLCTGVTIENLVVEGQTDSYGVYLWDCTNCKVDGLYFDGGASKKGYGIYTVALIGSTISNCYVTNCFGGIGIGGAGSDTSTRTIEDAGGNTISNCYVSNCTSQAYDINGTTRNTVVSCHAQDYAGVDVHKAFQVKDAVGYENRSIGNTFIGCTVDNYPAGFGGVRASSAKFIGCFGSNLSTNFIELTACNKFNFMNCECSEFAQVGIYTSSSSSGNIFNGIRLNTTTAVSGGYPIGIQFHTAASGGSHNFDNIVTTSTLAEFMNINAGSGGCRFGPGCRPNAQTITDAATSTEYPFVYRTTELDITSAGNLGYSVHMNRGMHVAKARFVATVVITGSPTVSCGAHNSTSSIAAAQAVTGASIGTTTVLTQASQLLATGTILTGRVGTAGTAGKGFVQFEGFIRV